MGRPHVTFNCAVSLDGKIGPADRSHIVFTSAEDRRRMSDRRAAADAVIVGGSTMRAAPQPLIEDPADGRAPRTKPVLNVVLSHTLDLPATHPAFRRSARQVGRLHRRERDGGPHARARERGRGRRPRRGQPSECAGGTRTARRRARAPRGRWNHGLAVLSRRLHRRGLPHRRHRCCSEGRGAPSPADGESWPIGHWPRLKLVSSEAVGDEVFLHYRRG